jgi:hypothetical protein
MRSVIVTAVHGDSCSDVSFCPERPGLGEAWHQVVLEQDPLNPRLAVESQMQDPLGRTFRAKAEQGTEQRPYRHLPFLVSDH